MSQLTLPPDSALYSTFGKVINSADRVFFAGLPGVGKSLLLQQLALMADAAGRRVHLLQWDVARQPFETPRYPLQDGATHPLVIKAVGAWVRMAIVQWQISAGAKGDMLLGEVPLIGGRFMEIARPADDEAEALLRDSGTLFLLPVPSQELRAFIESKREQSIAAPQHKNEAHDAPPDLLRALWLDLHRVAGRLGMVAEAENVAYSPAIYAAVYRHLLQHRQAVQLDLNRPLPSAKSVYEGMDARPYLRATPAEAAAIMAKLEAALSLTVDEAWHEV